MYSFASLSPCPLTSMAMGFFVSPGAKVSVPESAR
jgi:hypothetical protein